MYLMALVPVIVGAAELPVGAPADVGMSSARLERIDATVERYVEAGVFPGR